jgi:hypothetical protein
VIFAPTNAALRVVPRRWKKLPHVFATASGYFPSAIVVRKGNKTAVVQVVVEVGRSSRSAIRLERQDGE